MKTNSKFGLVSDDRYITIGGSYDDWQIIADVVQTAKNTCHLQTAEEVRADIFLAMVYDFADK